MRKTILLLALFILINPSCDKKTTPPEDTGIKPIEPEMVLIDRNLTFTYGESWLDIQNDSLICIILTPYHIAKYELTNIEYYQFVKDNGYNNSEYWSEQGWQVRIDSNWALPMFWDNSLLPYNVDYYSNKDNTPVHGISFYEAEAYVNWLSSKTGDRYVIPKTTQWQRAAKGPYNFKYPWGNTWSDNKANYIVSIHSELQTIDSYQTGISTDGCFNMIGNVYEFTIPITPILGNKDWKGLYSFPNFLHSTEESQIKSMTTISGMGIMPYRRKKGQGMRVVKIF